MDDYPELDPECLEGLRIYRLSSEIPEKHRLVDIEIQFDALARWFRETAYMCHRKHDRWTRKHRAYSGNRERPEREARWAFRIKSFQTAV